MWITDRMPSLWALSVDTDRAGHHIKILNSTEYSWVLQPKRFCDSLGYFLNFPVWAPFQVGPSVCLFIGQPCSLLMILALQAEWVSQVVMRAPFSSTGEILGADSRHVPHAADTWARAPGRLEQSDIRCVPGTWTHALCMCAWTPTESLLLLWLDGSAFFLFVVLFWWRRIEQRPEQAR